MVTVLLAKMVNALVSPDAHKVRLLVKLANQCVKMVAASYESKGLMANSVPLIRYHPRRTTFHQRVRIPA